MAEKIVSVDPGAARAKVIQAGKRVASSVSGAVAEKGSAARERVSETGKRVASSVSQSVAAKSSAVKEKASAGRRAALTRLMDTGLKVTQKQQAALEKLRDRVSAR